MTDYSDLIKRKQQEKEDKQIYCDYLKLIKITKSFFATVTALSFSYSLTFEEMSIRLEEIETKIEPNK